MGERRDTKIKNKRGFKKKVKERKIKAAQEWEGQKGRHNMLRKRDKIRKRKNTKEEERIEH